MKRELKNKSIGVRDIFLTIIISLLIISLHPIYVLEASDYKTEEYLKSWSVKKGDRFNVEHVHSVQLVPVIEMYLIDDKNNIILEESYFYSYGAGLPATTSYEFEMTENGFRIYNINEKMDNLVYRTGAIRANHQINIKGKSYDFLGFSKPRTGVKLEVKRIFFLQHIVKEVI